MSSETSTMSGLAFIARKMLKLREPRPGGFSISSALAPLARLDVLFLRITDFAFSEQGS